MSTRRLAPLAVALLLAACNGQAQPRADKDVAASEFPAADRPVSPITSSRWSTEEARDRVREADRVMDLAAIGAGMTVADIGAGEGYYTIRLAERVGAKGRVLAQDVVPEVREQLAARVYREQLDNVSVTLGGPADPRLPENSFDRILMVHMYHEIEAPYEFLWRLRPSLRKGGQVVIVDADRPTAAHGTPQALLDCEMGSLGYRKRETHKLPQSGVYVAIYEIGAVRPQPRDIRTCRNGA
jgi:ubiquinone/menaquinone biosynthesis C-methylase UbiE